MGLFTNKQAIDEPITTGFDHLVEKNGSTLSIDDEHEVLKVSWNGIVTAETASFILGSALVEVSNGNASKILLDRGGLGVFTKGTRLWIKEDFLSKRAKSVFNRIDKIASIIPRDPNSTIYANLVTASIKITFPGLAINEYSKEASALEWLKQG